MRTAIKADFLSSKSFLLKTIVNKGITRDFRSLFVTYTVFTRLRLTLFKYFLVCQEIQESDSQHTEFVLFAMNVITNNDNLTKVVID